MWEWALALAALVIVVLNIGYMLFDKEK